jgi:hypothetical protein
VKFGSPVGANAVISGTISGTVGLTPGSSVGLSAGSTVGLASGTSVGLASGTSVGLASGTTVGLASGTSVGLAPNTSVTTSTPEALLDTVAGAVSSAVVAVPSGAQSLVLLDPSGNGTVPSVTGATSGNGYVVLQPTTNTSRWYVPVDAAIDTSVTVTWLAAPSTTWYVIASIAPGPLVYLGAQQGNATSIGSGADCVLEGGLDQSFVQRARLIDTLRRPAVVLQAPSSATGDHPAVELQTAKLTAQTAAGTLIAAPGAGKRLRLFEAGIACVGGTGVAGLNWTDWNANAGAIRAMGGFFLGGSRTFPLSGVALSTNTAVTIAVGGTVTYDAFATYSVETV